MTDKKDQPRNSPPAPRQKHNKAHQPMQLSHFHKLQMSKPSEAGSIT
jgi:hypothetical protein